jgi:sulfur carrier protein ThiS
LENSGKQRKQLSREVVLALRELAQQRETNSTTQDLVAFISINLQKISVTVDSSVVAWEKRGYWVKADRFRLDWAWSENYASLLKNALKAEKWDEIAMISAKVAEKLKDVKLPQKHNLGSPWIGASKKLYSD